MNAIKK